MGKNSKNIPVFVRQKGVATKKHYVERSDHESYILLLLRIEDTDQSREMEGVADYRTLHTRFIDEGLGVVLSCSE